MDKPWLKYYSEDAEEKANAIPEGKTVWDVVEESLYKYINIPAIEYFGRSISRKEFIDNVYLWAKAFKNLGVKENEIVVYYGPFMPDVCFMIFALNMIGACPYFLKLAISPEALAEETKECRIAIVFDQMWENVSCEFSKDRFERVIIARITDAMATPKKQIVSLLSGMKKKVSIPNGKKYLSVAEARKLARNYGCEVKVAFEKERNAFITSSSGTTVGNVVKGVVATNESTIAQLLMSDVSDVQYYPGDRCLNNFPPTASTALNVMFFMALYQGETVVIDPRVSEKDFYYQIIKYKPNIALTTGSVWEAFFDKISLEMKRGKQFNFSCDKGWTIGGEGTTCKKFTEWNRIISRCAGRRIYSGYGSSELFSAVSVELKDHCYDCSKSIMSVGIPYAGIAMGVFDNEGNELTYNQRGELRIKSKAAMKCYYNKPELTAKTKVDGWIRTGDLAEIDEKGFVYIWGRMTDKVTLPSGREIYLFDVANKVKEKDYIDDAIVLNKPVKGQAVNLVAHIVWDKAVAEEDKEKNLKELTDYLKEWEPEAGLCTYAVHERMLPYSSTTLKKDKNKMAKQTEGYVQVVGDTIEEIYLGDA